MKVAIFGTGGVGGYFGGKIANAGHDVTFIARGEHLKAIQANGLKVKSISGDFLIQPAEATDDIKKIKDVELVIIAVKAWQVKDAAKELKTVVGKDAVVMPLQNGVSAAEEITEELNRENVIGGLCKIISKVEAPGVIHHFGVEPTIVFGELNKEKTARIGRLKELFDEAGINSIAADDIHAELWKKFIAICVSGLLAVTQSTYGVVRELEETRIMMRELVAEIYTVALRAGIDLNDDIVEKTMDFIDSFPYDSTSSLTRDVWEGKPSEIEYQNGTVVKLGRKYDVDTPVNRFVYNCILPLELRARKRV